MSKKKETFLTTTSDGALTSPDYTNVIGYVAPYNYETVTTNTSPNIIFSPGQIKSEMKLFFLTAYLPEEDDQEFKLIVEPTWIAAKDSDKAKLKFAAEHKEIDVEKHEIREIFSVDL